MIHPINAECMAYRFNPCLFIQFKLIVLKHIPQKIQPFRYKDEYPTDPLDAISQPPTD